MTRVYTKEKKRSYQDKLGRRQLTMMVNCYRKIQMSILDIEHFGEVMVMKFKETSFTNN